MSIAIISAVVASSILFASKGARGSKRKNRPSSCPDYSSSYGSLSGYDFRQEMIGGASPKDQVPVVVFFHARGVQANISRSFPSANRPARVIMPESNLQNEMGAPIWFQGRAADIDQDSLADEMIEESKSMAHFLKSLRRCYPGVPMILTGYSQGGMMTLLMGATNPGFADYLVPVSAWLPESLWPVRMRTPTYALHGASDQTIPSDRSLLMYMAFEDEGSPLQLDEIQYDFVEEQPDHGTKYLPWSKTLGEAIGRFSSRS